MGGTITCGGGAPAPLPTSVAGATGAPPAGISGGGPLVAQPQPEPQFAATAPPVGDLATAVAQLQGVLEQLSAVLGAMQGGAAVQGGGGTAVGGGGGCGCGMPDCTHGSAGGATAGRAPAGAMGGVEAARPDAPATGGDLGSRIAQIARAEFEKGVSEDAGPDDDRAGNIRKYRSAVTGPGEDPNAAEAWCADFASWVLKQAGVPFGEGGRGEDYTVAMIDWAKSKGRYHERGSHDPKPGDLVMIDWGGGKDVDHVAVVEKVENGRVHTIGGNEADGIREASYPMGDARMMGFITPA